MATLKEVAAVAGVSPATASRILNQDPTLSVQPLTRERVMGAARELGYAKPARTVVRGAAGAGESMTLGILQWFSSAQEMEDTYYLSIRQGIEHACLEQRIPVIRTFKSDLNYREALLQADAIIGVGKFSQEEIRDLRSLTDKLLLIDMPLAGDEVSTITLDFDRAVVEALDYLTGLGHREIGFLSGIEFLDEAREVRFADRRREAFIRYCEEHGIRYEPYLYEEQFSMESGYRMMTAMIESGELPTAIFAASDPIAMGAMRALQDRGFRVPEDISILGFNDIGLAAFTMPPLTTMHAPSVEMGQYGAALIRQMSTMEHPVPLRIQMPCQLQVRQSCGPVPKK